ncbi:MAG: hypothetical protein BGO55_06485 [Sphingobacteriales bacterium 50-39]|nr:hypothetical protein [Sphingobacteriales bacterium]OJW52904.1 MAG: hypothetical protein BGO55_06485 [Sphingobacteriales bacterium 50-39]
MAVKLFVLRNYDVYVVGNGQTAAWDHAAVPWKNGSPHIVGDNTVSYNSFTRGIAVTGGKVYVTGFSFNTPECPAYCNGRSRASYWVDNGGTITQTQLVACRRQPGQRPPLPFRWRQ